MWVDYIIFKGFLSLEIVYINDSKKKKVHFPFYLLVMSSYVICLGRPWSPSLAETVSTKVPMAASSSTTPANEPSNTGG